MAIAGHTDRPVSQFRDYPWDNVAGLIAWLRQEKEKRNNDHSEEEQEVGPGRTHEEANSMERDDKVNLRKEDEEGAESSDDLVVARKSQRLQSS